MKFLEGNVVLILLIILLLSSLNTLNGYSAPFYPNIETEKSSFQLFYYWDLRNRDSSFQVFNTSNTGIRVHVQVFMANSTVHPCEDIDFVDEFTPFDTHIYQLKNLIRNNGTPLPPDFGVSNNTFGFAVVTVVSATGLEPVMNPVLQGSFRIVDNSGYEYRANPAGVSSTSSPTDHYSFNFDTLGSSTFSDVVGIPIIRVGSGFGIVQGGQNIFAKFDLFIVDEDENDLSCSPAIFTCSASGLNKGINNTIRNTKDNSRICNTSQNTGLMRFEPPLFSGGGPGLTQAEFFVGFIGLNDGANIGSMDSFIATP